MPLDSDSDGEEVDLETIMKRAKVEAQKPQVAAQKPQAAAQKPQAAPANEGGKKKRNRKRNKKPKKSE